MKCKNELLINFLIHRRFSFQNYAQGVHPDGFKYVFHFPGIGCSRETDVIDISKQVLPVRSQHSCAISKSATVDAYLMNLVDENRCDLVVIF